ncbi:hypothetical protein AX14_008984 [Amanita brunnescens Koide BX004]|nr:hypothetical protein AX14_008984 [Amanita brunnescens Koide BX004]
MVLSPSGPPGPKRPISSTDPSIPTSSSQPHIFSPAPSKPSTSWSRLLISPALPPTPHLPPTAFSAAALPATPCLNNAALALQSVGCLPTSTLSANPALTNISTTLAPVTNPSDPWTRAHMHICAHAADACAACSIALVCCSCRALRFTPGPPPASPATPAQPSHRSRSASPVMFRDVGNAPSPAYTDCNVTPDDDAYMRALAECDTCDNFSCPRGSGERATWTLIVQQFDEGAEEFYDRTFRACGACNRACKRSFMGHKILSHAFDNSSSKATARITTQVATSATLAVDTPADTLAASDGNALTLTIASTSVDALTNSRPTTPLQVFSAVTRAHPNRFRGGARSTRSSSKKGSSSSSQSSGLGSLASARSQQHSPDPFVATAPAPGTLPTQSSVDEIDAFTEKTIRISDTVVPRDASGLERSARAPSPSSNLPSGPPPVFSRPPLPIVTGATEDVPTAVPSRVPSRAASVRTTSSIGDEGIANEPQPSPFPAPVPPPAFNDVIGRIHRRFPLASLKVDDEDSRHFLARDNTRVDDIANETDYLLSSHTSWPSILYFIRDTMKFESIQGPMTDFQVVLSGLAEIWSDAASFDARELLRDMLDASRLLPKAEREIDRLETTTDAELSRLRQAANDTLDSNARLLTEIDQLRTTDAVVAARECDEAQLALKDAIAHAKAAMAKQVSRYQHLANIADECVLRIQGLEKESAEKDAYILNTEREHAEIYQEREAAERSVATLKQQLQDATSLFETTREARRHDQEDFDERTTALKKHIAELNTRLNLLPSGEMELRSLVTDANERAGIAEEEYRKKSAELKLANKELASLKEAQKEISALKVKLTELENKQPSTVKVTGNKKEQTPAPSSKKVRWGFEPADEYSQPFWDHSNEYSRYIANMVAATVTALPNIPMQTAISTAIETVRAAGLTILSQPATTTKGSPVSNTKRSPSPSPASASPPAAPPRRSRAPSPSPSKTVPVVSASAPVASMTFAQMAATILDPPAAAPMHPAKAKPTWRAIETNKSLVLRPGTKGTRVSELHIRVPKVPATAHLYSLSGTKLINEVLRLVNESHNKAGIRALKDNHLVLVKWSMRGNLIFKCSKPMDDVIKECLHDAIKAAVPPSSMDSIAILNKPPTTALKFSSVPRHNADGTDTDSFDLLNDLLNNDLWRDVEIFSQPRFLPMKLDAAGGTVIVSLVDDNTGSVGRKLMNTVVNFSGASRRCLRWVEKEVQLHCTQCQGWGHLNFNCLSNIMRCSKCAGPHDYRQHDRYCEVCKAGKGHLCLPKCFNCRGAHFSNSKDCVFYINRSSKERQIQLRDEFSQKWKEEEAALKAAANSDSGRAARSAAAVKDARGKNKGKAKAPTNNDDDNYVPVGRNGKAKYTFGGMARPLAPTTRIDDVTDKKEHDDDIDDSDASSELRLSYVDDIPLRQRFPPSKPPTSAKSAAIPSSRTTTAQLSKPLTITLPATSHKPLRSVTDILRELKNPTTAATAKSATLGVASALPEDVETRAGTRFGGGEVEYSASALKSEAAAFADALSAANLPSQPSPPAIPGPEVSAPTPPQAQTGAVDSTSQLPTRIHD